MKNRKSKTSYKWLRDITSNIDYGLKWTNAKGKSGIIHVNTNDEVLDYFTHGFAYGFDSAIAQGLFLSRMTNKMYDRHFAGDDTFYFTGDGRSDTPYTLAMIDIDCHKCGSLAGAIAFVKWLKAKMAWEHLYFEVSTNGNGIHGYLLISKHQLVARVVNEGLKRLQQHLRELLIEWRSTLSDGDPTIEDVEIKGLCPEFTWGDEQGQITNYKSGILAKLPRDVSRFDEWQNTTTLSVYRDLLKFKPVEKPTREKKPIDRTKHIRIVKPSCGSTSGKVIGEDEIGQLTGHYADVSRWLLENHEVEAKRRVKVTVEDLAISLMVLRYMTNNVNADGTMPTKRIEAMWQALYHAGDINRQWDHSRFSAIRQYLSSVGLLDVDDDTYLVGCWQDGRHKKGRAMKWRLSGVAMDLLKWERLEQDKQEDDCVVLKEEEREAPLARTQITDTIQQLPRIPEMRPTMVISDYIPPLHLRVIDEIDAQITCFEDQIRVAA